eukprot:SM004558S16104  [mRNA]  locus=s4558:10:892:- [translate_table: standard]
MEDQGGAHHDASAEAGPLGDEAEAQTTAAAPVLSTAPVHVPEYCEHGLDGDDDACGSGLGRRLALQLCHVVLSTLAALAAAHACILYLAIPPSLLDMRCTGLDARPVLLAGARLAEGRCGHGGGGSAALAFSACKLLLGLLAALAAALSGS